MKKITMLLFSKVPTLLIAFALLNFCSCKKEGKPTPTPDREAEEVAEEVIDNSPAQPIPQSQPSDNPTLPPPPDSSSAATQTDSPQPTKSSDTQTQNDFPVSDLSAATQTDSPQPTKSSDTQTQNDFTVPDSSAATQTDSPQPTKSSDTQTQNDFPVSDLSAATQTDSPQPNSSAATQTDAPPPPPEHNDAQTQTEKEVITEDVIEKTLCELVILARKTTLNRDIARDVYIEGGPSVGVVTTYKNCFFFEGCADRIRDSMISFPDLLPPLCGKKADASVILLTYSYMRLRDTMYYILLINGKNTDEVTIERKKRAEDYVRATKNSPEAYKIAVDTYVKYGGGEAKHLTEFDNLTPSKKEKKK